MSRVIRFAVLVAAALLATTAVVAAAVGMPVAVLSDGASAHRIVTRDRVLLISDSAWLGIHNYSAVDALQGASSELDLASCRRRVTASCTNNGIAPITLLEELNHRGNTNTHTLVVATGYNDSDHNFESDFDTIVTAARKFGYQQIVWVTLRSNGVTYVSPDEAGKAEVFRNNNATLKRLVGNGDYPDVVIADFANYAYAEDSWFSANDGIHLTPLGTFAAADYISRKLAFLDQRACPQPIDSTSQIANPCPDPDATGPKTDLEDLYPVGQWRPGQRFCLEWRGYNSWPDTPWWEHEPPSRYRDDCEVDR